MIILNTKYIIIVGRGEPLYQFESKGDNNGDATTALRQFVLHASLDSLHSLLWSNSSTFLRVVDRFNSYLVSAYVTPGGTTMLLLHNGNMNFTILLLLPN